MHPALVVWSRLDRDPTEVETRQGRTLDAPCAYSSSACYKADASDWVETAKLWADIARRVIGPEARGLQARAGMIGYAAKSRAYVDTVLDAMDVALEASLAVHDVLSGREYDPEATDLEAADQLRHVGEALADAVLEPPKKALKRGLDKAGELLPDWLTWIPIAAVLVIVGAALAGGDE